MRGMSALDILLEQEGKEIPGIKQKTFVSKHPWMKLDDYSKAPADFWENVKPASWETMRNRKNRIDADKLEEMARLTKYPNNAVLMCVERFERRCSYRGIRSIQSSI